MRERNLRSESPSRAEYCRAVIVTRIALTDPDAMRILRIIAAGYVLPACRAEARKVRRRAARCPGNIDASVTGIAPSRRQQRHLRAPCDCRLPAGSTASSNGWRAKVRLLLVGTPAQRWHGPPYVGAMLVAVCSLQFEDAAGTIERLQQCRSLALGRGSRSAGSAPR